ncbi:alpha/beta hydrolase family protein [uncultured Proteiniphilum sp.]|uniref:alpha/beta hydrolase n=1 Tax=uncultured Proteiniphilum sp. TaxID=497637 RepID=UPI00261E7704|nr:alpha/beta hydrolase family protein [uncultured Proteiniphilum sp.]
MKRFAVVPLLLTLCVVRVFPATVDTVNVFSGKMDKEVKTVIIKPQSYDGQDAFPVLYLLHGYSDRYDGWVNKAPHIKELSDTYGIIIVCPDGAFGSWYFDSPVDPAFQYETFISKELIAWVDGHYSTIPSRQGRAITGLSMGGHGGLYLAFRNQDVFGACGSMSGGVDIRPFPNNWDIAQRIGSQRDYPQRWEENTVMGLLHLLTPNTLKIIIDCGTEDFFYAVNERLHDELLYRNIPHDYITRPGAHNWEYWGNAVKYQALFFHEYFKSRP